MRIAFTGGGTGGHIFPNVAIIDEIKRNADIFYIGGKNSLEEKLIKERGIPFYGIHAGKLRRYWDLKNIMDTFKIPLSIFESFRILKKLKPDLLFAKGGYVSVPVVLAARLLRIPVWLHESDVSPGLATKICSTFAQKIFLSFEESKKFFLHKKNVEVVGNPIRRNILNGSKDIGGKLTGFSPKLPVVLVMGGSIGAASLNRLVVEILPDLLKIAQVMHIRGTWNVERGTRECIPRYKSFQFLHEDLAHIYAIADLVVSRAGSGSIFELLALKKLMILVPLPKTASRGEQIENASIFEKCGFCHVIPQEILTPAKLLSTIKEMLSRLFYFPKTPIANAARNIAEKLQCHLSP